MRQFRFRCKTKRCTEGAGTPEPSSCGAAAAGGEGGLRNEMVEEAKGRERRCERAMALLKEETLLRASMVPVEVLQSQRFTGGLAVWREWF
ncbi:hypothetical protein ACLOJK_012396 [Asimina triloba]